MRPVFILAPPRTRTAWLATYLTGAGLYCFHEAWTQVKTVRDLRHLMESKGSGLVGNSDCGNWLFLEDLQREFPDALYVKITRTGDMEQAWADAFGVRDWTVMSDLYATLESRPLPPLVASIDFHAWTPDISLALWHALTNGRPMDQDWHRMMHRLNVQLTTAAIQDDQRAAREGRYAHATESLVMTRGL